MATKRTHTPSINICLNFLCIEIETTTCHHERMEGILLQTPPSSSSLKMRNLNRSWTEKSQMNPNGPQIDSEPFFLKMRKYATQPKRYVRAHRFSLVIVWRQTHRLQNASTSETRSYIVIRRLWKAVEAFFGSSTFFLLFLVPNTFFGPQKSKDDRAAKMRYW